MCFSKNFKSSFFLKTSKDRQKGFSTQVVIIGIAAVLFLGLFAGLIYKTKQNKAAQVAKKGQTAKIENTGWLRGASNAAVVITEFSDLQCPACKFHEPTIQAVLKNNPDTVALQYKHFPLSGHKYGVNAAMASEAAGKQNKFWEMHDILFEKQSDWEGANPPEPLFEKYAQSLKLDTEQFKKDLHDGTLRSVIIRQRDEGIKFGVNATPTFFVNGKLIATPNGLSEFQSVIDEELAP